MKSRILHSSYVINFLDEGFNSEEISKILKPEVDNVLSDFKNEAIKDWEIHFVFTYTNVKGILIYRKSQSYPKEKYKDIVIHIPIPTNDIVSWGVDVSQHIYDKNHLDKIIKNFSCLEVSFSKFTDRKSFLLDCMRRSIKFCIEEGFVINGIKVKQT